MYREQEAEEEEKAEGEGGEQEGKEGGDAPLSPVSRLLHRLATKTSESGSGIASVRGSLHLRGSGTQLSMQAESSDTREAVGEEDSAGGMLAPGGVSGAEGLADVLRRRRRLQRQEAALGVGLSDMVGGWGLSWWGVHGK
jgi:hypothetical protein